MIYLDNAATTKVDEDIIDEVILYMTDNYGNPSSVHSMGSKIKWKIDSARESIARFLNCSENEIYFTSGATESNNWAIKIAFRLLSKTNKKNHIITTKFEHDSVLKVCKYLEENEGAQVTYLDVEDNGVIDINKLKDAITEDTIIISIMYVNNEIGTIQPIEEISKIANKKNIFFHTDAVQALNKLEIDLNKLDVGSMSFSGHKIHALKGIGILYLNKKCKFKSYIHGGSQQRSRRAGTENVCGIISLQKAIEKFDKEEILEIKKKRDYFLDKILTIGDVVLNGDRHNRVCNNINVSFLGCDSEDIIFGLDMRGICVSGGSACESGALDVSHVLRAIRKPIEVAKGAIRITLSKYTTYEEIDSAYIALKETIKNIRQVNYE